MAADPEQLPLFKEFIEPERFVDGDWDEPTPHQPAQSTTSTAKDIGSNLAAIFTEISRQDRDQHGISMRAADVVKKLTIPPGKEDAKNIDMDERIEWLKGKLRINDWRIARPICVFLANYIEFAKDTASLIELNASQHSALFGYLSKRNSGAGTYTTSIKLNWYRLISHKQNSSFRENLLAIVHDFGDGDPAYSVEMVVYMEIGSKNKKRIAVHIDYTPAYEQGNHKMPEQFITRTVTGQEALDKVPPWMRELFGILDKTGESTPAAGARRLGQTDL